MCVKTRISNSKPPGTEGLDNSHVKRRIARVRSPGGGKTETSPRVQVPWPVLSRCSGQSMSPRASTTVIDVRPGFTPRLRNDGRLLARRDTLAGRVPETTPPLNRSQPKGKDIALSRRGEKAHPVVRRARPALMVVAHRPPPPTSAQVQNHLGEHWPDNQYAPHLRQNMGFERYRHPFEVPCAFKRAQNGLYFNAP